MSGVWFEGILKMNKCFTALLLLVCVIAPANQFLFQGHIWYYTTRNGWNGVYYGRMGVEGTGVYYAANILTRGKPDVVFYLVTQAASGNALLRLIFYCKNGTLAIVPPKNLTKQASGFVDGGYTFCDNPTQIPFRQGTAISVKGTMISPSQWTPYVSTPDFDFYADFYVMGVL
jgi:hypothetical protein